MTDDKFKPRNFSEASAVLSRSAIPLAITASDITSRSENFSEELPLLKTRM
jgi:hypothetical protein